MNEMNLDVNKSQLPRIFQMMSINSFGISLISIFIPIYLLQLGYSFQMVMVWLIIQHSSLLLNSFLTILCSNRIGLVHCLHIRFVLLLSYLLLMFVLPSHRFLFFCIPILIGMEAAFFWIPLNILFVRNTEKDTMGGSLSKFFAYPKVFSMLSPLVGGFIALYLGFPTLFIFAISIVFVAFIPLLPLRSEKTHFILSWSTAKETYKRQKKYFIPEVIDNFTEDAGIIWSLFIYLQLISITQVGIVSALASFAGIFFTLTLGRLTDTWNKHKLLKIGAISVTLIWIGAFFIGTYIPIAWLFYMATVIMALSMKVFLVPYQSMLFNSARRDDAQFIVLREVPTVLGRLILYATTILLYKKLPLVFLTVGIVFIYFWFFNSKKLVASDSN